MDTFHITDNQLRRILRAPGISITVTDRALAELRRELTNIRIEIVKIHAWAPQGHPSTLRRKVSALPKRVEELLLDLDPQNQSALLKALEGADRERRIYEPGSHDSTIDFENATRVLSSLSSLATYLIDRIAVLDAYNDTNNGMNFLGDMQDAGIAKRYKDSLENLYRQFRKRDRAETPIILALVGLSRSFKRNFPKAPFMTNAQHNKNGSAILDDLRFDSPGTRFAAQALKELRLFSVFGMKSKEQLQNLVGDAWNNNKSELKRAENLFPQF